MRVMILLCLLLGLTSANQSRADEGGSAPALKGKLLFEDTFERRELGKAWDVHPNSFRIDQGVLIAGQRPDADHGAVSQTFLDFQDLILEFSFRLDGAAGFNLVIDDRRYKNSHAGHICRVTVRANRIAFQDDKTGAMRNDIFAQRQDPKTRKQAEKLLAGKSQAISVKLQKGRWYRMRVDIVGDRMQVTLDDKLLGTLRSEGIAHKTKTDFGFTIPGRFTHFDDVRAWSVETNSKAR